MLPLLDGTSISVNNKTRVKTKNILFVGSGTFEKVKPTDLILELQGRMPIRAAMEVLTYDDYLRILTETEHNIIQQQIELLRVENVEIAFEKSAIEWIAWTAVELNEEDNTGARRLWTVLESVLEEINFEAADLTGE